jgi:pilus assembly protein Flp/PilA
MKRRVLARKEKGQGLVEYALLLVLIAIVVISILALLGPAVGNVFSNILIAIQGGGSITGISAQFTPASGPSPSQLTLTIDVSEPTEISVSGDASGTFTCNPPTCQHTFTDVPSSGSATVSGGGSQHTVSW